MNYIVYQAHSNVAIHYEVIYSIYSFLAKNESQLCTFIIYTDSPSVFEKLLPKVKVQFEVLKKETLEEWKGERQFVHRLKINLILDVLKKYHGNFLYLDSDTYFKSNITHIFKSIEEGKRYMHCFEKKLDKSKVYKPLYNHTVKYNDKTLNFDNTISIYNAGAISFSNSDEHLIQDVLRLNDLLYEYYQKHIIEQFSFSYLFQSESPISSIQEEIDHYWDLKEFRVFLIDLFSPVDIDFDKVKEITASLNPGELMDQKIKWKKSRNLWDRILRKNFKLPSIKP